MALSFSRLPSMASWAILNYADYNAAKAGVIELTKSMALELAPKIRVNAIAAVVSGERCVFLHDRVSAGDGWGRAGGIDVRRCRDLRIDRFAVCTFG